MIRRPPRPTLFPSTPLSRSSPASSNLTAGQTVQLTATLKDGAGNVVINRPITWASSDSAMATVSGSGLRSEEHTSELQSLAYLVCRLLLEKKKVTTPYGAPA